VIEDGLRECHLLSHGAPTAVEGSETKPWGFSQRRVTEGRKREEERMEPPMVAISDGVAYIPPALERD
jgi:hypothetical protein